jgi:hypothetical integral membrane protein (TIGR02206 family)
MLKPFVFMGASHVTAIAITFAVPLALSALSRTRNSIALQNGIRWTLAAIVAVNWVAWMILLYAKGWLGIGNEIPLNLCDWATVATFVALVHPTQKSFELSYFWGLCGTLQALLTPDCVYDFPDVQFTLFFVYHGGIIASVLYLTLGMKMRPVPMSFPRVIAWTLFYGAVAGAVDAMLGTDYGFLRSKPDHLTLLSYLSLWPYYLPELVLVAIVFMAICYLPFFIADMFSLAKTRANSSHSKTAV